MKTILKNICIVTALLLFIPFLGACTENRDKESPGNEMSVGELMSSMDIKHMTQPVKAPDFELSSAGGGEVGLSQHRGKVVLLSFWTTW